MDNDVIMVRALSRKEMDQELETGVATLRRMVMASCGRRRGILLTRLSPNDFRIELHETVPYGETIEREVWR
jgi:hypothetical protein